MESNTTPQPYKALIEDNPSFTPTTSLMTALGGDVGKGFRIATDGQVLATLSRIGWFSEVGMELCMPSRRLRLDHPDDRSFWEGWTLFGMPRRRMVWRAGHGVAAEIAETSMSRKQLSGRFELDGKRYNVRCTWSRGSGHNYHRQVYDAAGLAAELAVNRAASGLILKEFIIRMHRPLRLDALAVSVHMMFWLQRSATGASGAGGGGGGGGGGGC